MEARIRRVEMDIEDMAIEMDTVTKIDLPDIKVEIAKLTTAMKIYGGLIIAGITALIVLGVTP